MNNPIGQRVDLKQYFHPHYLWNRNPEDFSDLITLGHYDTISTEPVVKLTDLAPKEINLVETGKVAPYTTTTISLIFNSFLELYSTKRTHPNEQPQPDESQFKEDIANLKLKTNFWVFVELNFSAVTVDFLKRQKFFDSGTEEVQFKSLAVGISVVGSKLKEKLAKLESEKIKYILYRSLGAQDFVIELKFNDEHLFDEVARLVINLRQMEFEEVCENSDAPNHHIFAQVNAICSFDSKKISERGTHQKPSLVRIRQKIRIAPGHEFEIFEQGLQGNHLGDQSDDHSNLCLGFESKNLHITFDGGFSEYVNSRNAMLTEHQQNTGSVRSEITVPLASFKTDKKDKRRNHANIGIRPDIHSTIDECVKTLDNCWKRKYLSKSQYDELSNLIQSTVQGISRNDKQTYLIDLIPFIQYIPLHVELMLNNDSLGVAERENFLKAINSSIELLTRSVRNRIDELTSFRDPMSPSNRTFVAPKLMSAYSTCAYYSWNLIKNSWAYLFSTRALAFVGVSGEVLVHRPFVRFHRHLLERGNSEIPKLLFYELSGPMLFRPEIVFISTIHEIAQESNWLDSYQNPMGAEFRDLKIKDILLRMKDLFRKELKSLDYDEPAYTGMLIDSFLKWAMPRLIDHIDPLDDGILYGHHNFPYMLKRVGTEEFFDSVEFVNDCSSFPANRIKLESILEMFISFTQFDSDPSDSATCSKNITEFITLIRSEMSCIEECFADFAMLFYLFRARSELFDRPGGVIDSAESMLGINDAEYLFSSIFETKLSASPGLLVKSAVVDGEIQEVNQMFSFENVSEYFYRAILNFYLCLRFDRDHRDSSSNVLYTLVTNRITSIVSNHARISFPGIQLDVSKLKVFIRERIKDLVLAQLLPYDKADNDQCKCLADYFIEVLKATLDPNKKSEWLVLPTLPYEKTLGQEFIRLWDAAIRPNSDNDLHTNFLRIEFMFSLWCESTFHDEYGIFDKQA